MAYTEQEARRLVVEAGLRLLETGLIARTWGNLSARISDTHFVITPSGLAYETLKPEQLVKVAIADCAYEGTFKPSSEKGIHADAYRNRPQAHFVIHTHQEAASIYGVAGADLRVDGGLLGSTVPCAAYGLSSTKKLRRAVTAAALAHPDSSAVFMRHHGVLIMGSDCENAFAVALALEKACQAQIAPPPAPQPVADLGCSARCADGFTLSIDGLTTTHSLAASLTGPAALHGAIYRVTDTQFIRHEANAAVAEISCLGKTVKPLLDDLVQIAGISIRCMEPKPEAVVRGLKGRNAVLLHNCGALCTGGTESDAEAACVLLRKDCAAQRFAAGRPGCKPVGKLDAWVERTIYVKKYAKKKGGM